MFFKRKGKEIKDNPKNIIEVQWGGYYSSKGDEGYGLFRLLDLNSGSYQIQLFKVKFDHLPMFEEIRNLRPFVWHAPIAIEGLLNRKELTLVGHEELDSQALQGYEEYLKQMGADEVSIKELLDNAIELSKQGIHKFDFQKDKDRVVLIPVE